MSRRKSFFLVSVAVIGVAGGVLYAPKTPVRSTDSDIECLRLHFDALPPGAELTLAVLDGPELRAYYEHAAGKGYVSCDLVRLGGLRTAATLNR